MDAQTTAMMLMIMAHIVLISMYGALLALFSYFMDFCFWRGNIFSFWLPFVARTVAKMFYKVKYENLIMIKDKTKRTELFIDLVEDHGLFKMLGGCAICFNIWIGFITYPIINVLAGHSFWYLPVYLLISSFILRKIMKVD